MEESRDSDLSKSKRWHTATRLPLPPMIRLTMSHCQSFRQSACSFFCASTADHYPVQGVKFSLRSGADVARLWNVQPHVYQPIELVILRWTAAELDVPRTKYTSKRLETRSREWSRAIYFERPREREGGREREFERASTTTRGSITFIV